MQLGLPDPIELGAQPRLAPQSELAFETGLLLEEDRRAGAAQHVGERRPRRQLGSERMQPMEMAQQRADNGDRRPALLEGFAEYPIDLYGVALRRRQDCVIEFDRRAVADRALRVLEFHAPALSRIKRKLFEFGAGYEAVVAKMLDEVLGRIVARRYSVRPQC